MKMIRKLLKMISWKAVIAGSAFDILGTNVVMLVYRVINLASEGAFRNPDALSDSVQASINKTLYQGFAIGTLMSILAGVVAVLIARRNGLLNSLVAFFLTLGIDLIMIYSMNSGIHYPEWLKYLGFAIMPFSYLLGGYVGTLINQKYRPHFELPFQVTWLLRCLFLILTIKTLFSLFMVFCSLIHNCIQIDPLMFLDHLLLLVAVLLIIKKLRWGYIYTMILLVLLLIGTVPGISNSNLMFINVLLLVHTALFTICLIFTFLEYRRIFRNKTVKPQPPF